VDRYISRGGFYPASRCLMLCSPPYHRRDRLIAFYR
jgi:hypothetical protein